MVDQDQYIIRITPLAFREKSLDMDDLRVKLSLLEELTIEDETSRMVSVRYPGSLDDLKELVGYSADKVLITPESEYTLANSNGF